jgi:hypothetical protein
MPTPNRGNDAAATAMVRNAMDMLSKALAALGPAGAASEVGKAVLDALKPLSKIASLAPGAVTPGAQQASQQQFMMEQRQSSPLLAQLAAMRGGQGGGHPGAGASPLPPPVGPDG